MDIKVLGTGCSKCKMLFSTVEEVVKELELSATLTKVEDMQQIMEYNIMTLPALVVNGEVVAKGKVSYDDVKSVLEKLRG